LILPNEITTYSASKTDPWHYRWIGFDGALSESFTALPPVFSYSTDWAKEMLEANHEGGVFEYIIAAKLFLMYAEFFADKKHKNDYVSTVIDYISALYMQEIRVEDIAKKMNLDRRYLSRIFKQRTGKSIQEHLISVRMDEAKKLLKSGHSVIGAAKLCGYDDVCNFSKMFKKSVGVSPGKWKE
jgi:YesN/AraC family two-component response regulator